MVSVVIPAYKNTEELVANLKNNLKYLKDCEVIVVNDYPEASIKNSLNQFSTVKLIENEKNLGFGSTVNIGVRNAKFPHVILLNSDVTLKDDSYKKALNHFKEDENLFAVSFAQQEKNGEIVGKNKIYFSHGFFQHMKSNNLTLGVNGWAEGGACMIDRDKFMRLGGFDNLFSPFYWEDIDLSYNAWKSGYKVLFDPEILVKHHHESTIGKYFQSGKIKKISYRNQLIFMWKNITNKRLCLSHTLFFIPATIQLILKGEVVFLGAFLLALTKLPLILMRRLTRGNTYKKTDSEVLSLFV